MLTYLHRAQLSPRETSSTPVAFRLSCAVFAHANAETSSVAVTAVVALLDYIRSLKSVPQNSLAPLVHALSAKRIHDFVKNRGRDEQLLFEKFDHLFGVVDCFHKKFGRYFFITSRVARSTPLRS